MKQPQRTTDATRLLGAIATLALLVSACGSSTPTSSPALSGTAAPSVSPSSTPAPSPTASGAVVLPPRPALPAGWRDFKDTKLGFDIAVPYSGKATYLRMLPSTVYATQPDIITKYGLLAMFEIHDRSFLDYCAPRVMVTKTPEAQSITTEDELVAWARTFEPDGAFPGSVVESFDQTVFPGGQGVLATLREPKAGSRGQYAVPTNHVDAYYLTKSGVWVVSSWACGNNEYTLLGPAMRQIMQTFVPLA